METCRYCGSALSPAHAVCTTCGQPRVLGVSEALGSADPTSEPHESLGDYAVVKTKVESFLRAHNVAPFGPPVVPVWANVAGLAGCFSIPVFFIVLGILGQVARVSGTAILVAAGFFIALLCWGAYVWIVQPMIVQYFLHRHRTADVPEPPTHPTRKELNL